MTAFDGLSPADLAPDSALKCCGAGSPSLQGVVFAIFVQAPEGTLWGAGQGLKVAAATLNGLLLRADVPRSPQVHDDG